MTVPNKSKLSLLIRLLGDPADTLLENRVLNGTMLLVLITGILSTIQNIVIHNSLRMLISTGASALAGITGYWFSRYKRVWKPLVLPIFLFFMILLAASWITQAGSDGAIGYYFFLMLTTAIVLFHGVGKFISLIAAGLEIVALLTLEFVRPDLIMPYNTTMQRFADVAFSLLFCLMISATMVYVVYREYQRERRSNDTLLSQMTADKTSIERAMKDKQRLLSMVCHDIANALTVAQTSVSMAKMQQKDNQATPLLEQSGFALNNIKEIINSVRLLEAVEQGRMSFVLEPVTLNTVLENVRKIFGDKLAERNMHLRIPQNDLIFSRVIAEPRILANQVISNLVSNAIRFSHPGSAITIGIRHDNDFTAITISDTGIGIPRELLEHLFDPNTRTSRPGTNGEPGTGFGMLTVKSFVDLFGGHIDVESKPQDAFSGDHGTTVTVFLKSAPPDQSI
jgi:signal transduction histidine kinase